jgi:hypothetical protein
MLVHDEGTLRSMTILPSAEPYITKQQQQQQQQQQHTNLVVPCHLYACFLLRL